VTSCAVINPLKRSWLQQPTCLPAYLDVAKIIATPLAAELCQEFNTLGEGSMAIHEVNLKKLHLTHHSFATLAAQGVPCLAHSNGRRTEDHCSVHISPNLG